MRVDGGRLLVGVEPIKTPSGATALESSITIGNMDCYWASLFTAAKATEQSMYLIALRRG